MTNSQTNFEFGYSFGANATTSRTIKSNNMTTGYSTPLYPSTWNNNLQFGWGSDKHKVFISFEDGGLGPTWQVQAYPNKYPYSNQQNPDGSTNFSIQTGFSGRARHNSNLAKFSVSYRYTFLQKNKFSHRSIIGAGYLKTRVRDASANFGNYFYLNDSIGIVNHGMIMDKYEYVRNQNIYLIFGYELRFKIKDRLNWNAQIMYNQGLYKMNRWHTYRTYSESATGYTEFDEQWSFTRLSYFAFLTGISFEIGGKKKNE